MGFLAAGPPDPSYLLELRSTRMAALELTLLATSGGVVGAFVVLRRLAFFSHAVGTATFPGLVLAAATGVSPAGVAAGVGAAYALAVERAGRGSSDPGAEGTGLLLVAALAIGTILAGDVFESGAGVDRLLFGTAVGLGGADLVVAAVVTVLALVVTLTLARTWTALAFDPRGAPALGLPARRADLALLLMVSGTVVAGLPAIGSLLAGSLVVVPAAVARLFATTVASLVGLAVGIAITVALVGLYGSLWLDVPPGPAIAVLGTTVYLMAWLGLAFSRTTARTLPGSIA